MLCDFFYRRYLQALLKRPKKLQKIFYSSEIRRQNVFSIFMLLDHVDDPWTITIHHNENWRRAPRRCYYSFLSPLYPLFLLFLIFSSFSFFTSFFLTFFSFFYFFILTSPFPHFGLFSSFPSSLSSFFPLFLSLIIFQYQNRTQ